jgi:hypothetical protein
VGAVWYGKGGRGTDTKAAEGEQMRVVSESTYRKNIKDNITLLAAAIEGGEYPNLAEVLNAYGRSLYRKLQVLLEYFSNYGHDIKQRMSYSDSRGWEMMASYEVMTTLGAGMDKATWEKAVLKLITMDMLRMFRPRTVEEYRYLNTDVQQLSAERALASGRKPVNWYHVPKYTKQRLKAADDLARAVKAGAAIDKDSLRDKLGAKQANKITDTGFDIYPDADDRRDTLEWMLGVKLRTFGYTTSKELISEAMEFDKSKGYTYKRWLQTWTAYKPFLFDKYGLHENKPSKAEKEKWGLVSDGWIVRARS